MTHLKESPVLETVKEPARVWFNWWRAHGSGWREKTWSPVSAGDVLRSHKSPSKEIAEQRAAEWLAKNGHPRIEYLGAFPEGERPSPKGGDAEPPPLKEEGEG